VSPDGNRIAVELDADAHKDIWIYEIATNIMNKLTDGGDNSAPEWMPDGRNIQFLSNRNGTSAVWQQPIDHSREAAMVLSAGTELSWGSVPSPDGRHILLQSTSNASVNMIAATVGAGASQQVFVGGNLNAWGGRFSPSGKSVAYVSDESGRPDVYVRPFPGPGARVQISAAGGIEPVWSPDGKQLYYATGNRLMVATLSPEPSVSVVRQDSLFSWASFGTIFSQATYDIAKDGRFLMIKPNDTHFQLVVTLNWTAQLATRLGKP
jgi:serine/threonine-protein kinase